MGLIQTFDLDFVMTSEREWGCYRTLPRIAIYQLSTRPGIDAIGLTRWVWNGRQRTLSQNLTGTEDFCDDPLVRHSPSADIEPASPKVLGVYVKHSVR